MQTQQSFICPKNCKHCGAIKTLFCLFEHPNEPDIETKGECLRNQTVIFAFPFYDIIRTETTHYSFKLSFPNMRNSHEDQQAKSAAVFIKHFSY